MAIERGNSNNLFQCKNDDLFNAYPVYRFKKLTSAMTLYSINSIIE